MFQIDIEQPADAPAIEQLLDGAFGPDRQRKASHAFRHGIAPCIGLSLVARRHGALVGTIRYWPVNIGTRPALLLGPLGVEPALRGLGIGRALVRTSLGAAGSGTVPILLVGDLAYYAQLGFVPAAPKVMMPGEQPERLLAFGPLANVPAGLVLPKLPTAASPPASVARSVEG